MFQIAECMRLCVGVVIGALLSGEDTLGAGARAACLLAALLGGAAALQYTLRRDQGWGAITVPLPSLSVGGLDLDASVMVRQFSNEMIRMPAKQSPKKGSIEVSPAMFSPTHSLGPEQLVSLTPEDSASRDNSCHKSAISDDGNPAQFDGGVLLSKDDKETLWKWLPYRQQLRTATLVYSGEAHGYNLHTLYRMCEQATHPTEMKRGYEHACITVIKTSRKEVLGAYTSSFWHLNNHYHGNGECFVFRLRPRARIFPWAKGNDMMMLGGPKSMSIGAGSCPAIWLDDELSLGMTAECETFNNPPLVSCEGKSVMPKADPTCAKFNAVHQPGRTQAVFRCVAIEVYMLL